MRVKTLLVFFFPKFFGFCRVKIGHFLWKTQRFWNGGGVHMRETGLFVLLASFFFSPIL